MSQSNKDRIIAISKKLGLTHVGSNLSCLPVLEEIYEKKKPDDIVILDNAHAHLAHLIAKRYVNAEDCIRNYGIHCDRKAGCEASGGSLGHGIGIGIGYALADRKRDVYVIVSDGSMMEGSNWEAVRICEFLRLKNIHIYCNFNGYSAVSSVNGSELATRMSLFVGGINVRFTDNGLPELEGLKGHYNKL